MTMLKERAVRKVLQQPNNGLLTLPHDNRDLGFNILHPFIGSYKPKHTDLLLESQPAKTQLWNTCGWVSLTGAKEKDEKVQLDPQVAVMFGMEANYIKADGYSNLRDNEKISQKKGISEIGVLKHYNPSNFKQYSDPRYLTKEVRQNAFLHRSKSYSKITSADELIKALDKGRPVRAGLAWRTVFNYRGGFRSPFVLNYDSGYFVGGHAVWFNGYRKNYNGHDIVIRGRNSYGTGYGLNGDFFITKEDLNRDIQMYGCFYNEDIEFEMAKWLASHQGRIVKTPKDPKVYLIQGDKKRHYIDLPTLIAHGRRRADITTVDAQILNSVKIGDSIDFWSGGNISQVQEMYDILKTQDPQAVKQFMTYLSNIK